MEFDGGRLLGRISGNGESRRWLLLATTWWVVFGQEVQGQKGPQDGVKALISSASASADGREARHANDGDATEESAWVSRNDLGGKWLQLGFGEKVSISEVHMHGGVRSIKGSLIGTGEVQIKDGEGWKKVAGFSGNKLEDLRILIEPQVEADEIRLWTAQDGQVAVRELVIRSAPKPLGEGLVFQHLGAHQVSVNQIGYNEGFPKRFTVPTASGDGVRFSVEEISTRQKVFTGEVLNGLGDFTKWKPGKERGDFKIRVEGGSLQSGESFPFAVGGGMLEDALLQPMVDFMIDARSVVGTHPSAFGGAAWRDGSYFTHELASLAMLFLAFSEKIEAMPRQIDWEAERSKVLAPEFKLVETRGDIGMLQAAKSYYARFEAPAPDAPDVVKLIHWGCGMAMVQPEIFDPSGDGIGRQVHSQLVEQFAYVLALQPRLVEWIPDGFFKEAERFVEQYWIRTGLLEVPLAWNPRTYKKPDDQKIHVHAGPLLNPYKGRHVPGHSILPNLLMYEVARREDSGRAIDYLKAAITQAEYVLREMDWKDPRHTKGHRMSEHKMITGLVWLLQNHPEQAPQSLKKKLADWADVAISRSDNYWDFRRYDMGDHWSIPVMNEPGNLAGFPACALSVSWVVEDPAKKQRLREIAIAALDCLFGRNPINAASPHHPELGWGGMIEKGWPVGFADGTTARLETCRGSLSSGPGSEMFPFNPGGRPRFPEGWSAFNAALNVGVAYIGLDSKSKAGLPPDCLKQEKK